MRVFLALAGVVWVLVGAGTEPVHADGAPQLPAWGMSDDGNTITAELPYVAVLEVEKTAVGQVIHAEGFGPGGAPGAPRLPFTTMEFLVPPDIDWDTVTLELERGEWEEIPGEYDLAPVFPAATDDDGELVLDWCGKAEVIRDGRDTSIYEADAFYPAQPLVITSKGAYRQWKMVTMEFWPLSYNPERGQLRRLRNGELVLRFERLDSSKLDALSRPDAGPFPGQQKFWARIEGELVNAPAEGVYYLAGATAGAGEEPPVVNPTNDYVIITTSEIQSNSSTQLNNFIAGRQAAGFTVKVVTQGSWADSTHYVSGSSASQRANNIRSWLASRYISEGIDYVLLIGNPHPSSFSSSSSVPMKMCWPRRASTTYRESPTDMFFSDLTGNWDRDGDGYYGEYSEVGVAGGIDRSAEVYVGRIPYYGSTTDLNNILSKLTTYGQATGSLPWRKKVLIPSSISNHAPQDHNRDGDASDAGEYPNAAWRTFGADWGQDVKSLATANGFSPYTLYERSGVYSDGSAYPLMACNAALTKSNLINAWKNYYGFVTWWGHGSSTGTYRRTWDHDNSSPHPGDRITQHSEETSSPSFIYSSDCTQLSNSYPSFVVAVSCNNGYPETTTNLGYSMLKNGGVGTFTASRVSWYALGDWSTSKSASYGDNASYGYRIFEHMGKDGETAGEALAWCRRNFGLGWEGSSWMNCTDFNLYGDPSLALEPGPAVCVDTWEPDNNAGQANTISTTGTPQTNHRFCDAGDQDWMKFYATDRWQYTIQTYNLGADCDTYMYLYQQNGSTEITHDDDSGPGRGSKIEWTAPDTGWYYVRVRHYSSIVSGIPTNYDIKIDSQEPPNRPPNVPSSPSPATGAVDQVSCPELRWSGGDPDTGDTVTYNVNVSTSNPPTTQVCDGVSIRWCMPTGLSYNTRYYWRVTAIDNHGAWTTGPVWEFRTAPSAAPGAVSVTPNSGSSAAGAVVEFESSYSDDNGWMDIKWAYLSVGTHELGADGFRAYYNQNSNKVYLMNDDGTAWLGGVPPGSSPGSETITDPESSATIENSKVILRPDAMTITSWGRRLNVKWSVIFKRWTTGDKTIYLDVKDEAGQGPGWRVRGDWTVNGTNGAPVPENVAPASGSSDGGDLVEFTTTCSDPNGWPQLKWIYLAIGDDPSGADGMYAYYSLSTNKVYLRNDAGTGWMGGLPPGSSQTIENSKAILRLEPMTVLGAGNRVSVKWSMRLKRLVTGSKTIYLKVTDDYDAVGGWKAVGNWTVNGTNEAPTADAVSPDSGSCDSGDVADFTTTCSDANGWPQMKWVTLAIGRNTSGADGVYAYYNQGADKVYLMNDAGTAWLGGLAPGSSQTIENSKVILRLEPMIASGAGDQLDLNWSFRFKQNTTGDKNIYLKATDDSNATSGWQTVGSWRVEGTNFAPSADSVAPNSGSSNEGDAADFTTSCSDRNGWPQIKRVTLAIGRDSSGADGLYAYYDPSSDKVYLRNDAGTGWLGGLSPGADRTIENSKVILRLAPMTVSGSGNTLEVKWALRFKRFVTGAKTIFLRVVDESDAASGWRTVGSWTVNGTNYAPAVESVSPNLGACAYGDIVDFTTTVSDPNGWSQLKWVYLSVGEDFSAADGLRAYYNLNNDKVYLIGDDGTTWLGGLPPGSSETIENSRVILRLAPMTVTGAGDELTVEWSLRFKRSAVGGKNIYVKVCDEASLCTTEKWLGAWAVVGPAYWLPLITAP